MRESQSDLWEMHRTPGHLVCISTNGFVKKNGCAVMGRGCAYQATQLHLGIAHVLGAYIKKNGNVPGILEYDMGLTDHEQQGKTVHLGILPVKHNWWEKTDLDLIKRSVDWLIYVLEGSHDTVHVPRLGCGNGGRDWEKEVRPLMIQLPDSVVVHS